MNQPVSLSIVIPVYNEEKNIHKVVLDHLKTVNDCKHLLKDWEIVCLDDASTDQSHEILQQLAQANNIRIIRHERNQGIYQSFDDLFKAAKGDYIYATGGDDQWPSENLTTLLTSLLSNNNDLVIGVRENRNEIYSLWRKILSCTFNLIPQLFYKTKTMDANGIKLGRREIFNLPLHSKSFFGEIERIIEAKKRGYSIGFSPIKFLSRTKGKAKGARWKNIWATLRDLFKYMFIYQSKSKRTQT